MVVNMSEAVSITCTVRGSGRQRSSARSRPRSVTEREVPVAPFALLLIAMRSRNSLGFPRIACRRSKRAPSAGERSDRRDRAPSAPRDSSACGSIHKKKSRNSGEVEKRRSRSRSRRSERRSEQSMEASDQRKNCRVCCARTPRDVIHVNGTPVASLGKLCTHPCFASHERLAVATSRTFRSSAGPPVCHAGESGLRCRGLNCSIMNIGCVPRPSMKSGYFGPGSTAA